MKKLIFTLVLAFSASLITHAQPVYSNIVGMYKVPKIAGGLQLLGVSIGNDTTLSQLIDIDQFTGGLSTTVADKIITFNPDLQTYVTYAKFDSTSFPGGTVAWRLTTSFFGDPSVVDVDPVLPAGTAVWVQAVSGDNVDLVVSGDVPVAETSSIEIAEGLNMLSLPFTTKIDINSTDAGFITSGATGSVSTNNADQIILWDSIAQKFITYALFDDTAFPGGVTVEWRLSTAFFVPLAQAIEIDVGEGFWYRSKKQFTWNVSNPYFDNL